MPDPVLRNRKSGFGWGEGVCFSLFQMLIPGAHLGGKAAVPSDFSGGKALCGPAATGILMGRRDLIEAAQLNADPKADTLGRAAKVGKEQIMGLLAAPEAYVRRDHEADQRRWGKCLKRIADDVRHVPTTTSEIFFPSGRGYPYLRVSWDVEKLGLGYEACQEVLMDGEPRIAVIPSPEGIEPFKSRASRVIVPRTAVIPNDPLFGVNPLSSTNRSPSSVITAILPVAAALSSCTRWRSPPAASSNRRMSPLLVLSTSIA